LEKERRREGWTELGRSGEEGRRKRGAAAEFPAEGRITGDLAALRKVLDSDPLRHAISVALSLSSVLPMN